MRRDVSLLIVEPRRLYYYIILTRMEGGNSIYRQNWIHAGYRLSSRELQRGEPTSDGVEYTSRTCTNRVDKDYSLADDRHSCFPFVVHRRILRLALARTYYGFHEFPPSSLRVHKIHINKHTLIILIFYIILYILFCRCISLITRLY